VAPIETLTHAFLDCPEAAPAVDWLRETWRCLTGVPVPRTAQVLLADDLRGWALAPSDSGTYRLWTRLRVATLGAIWRVRCARDDDHSSASFAHKAVTIAVDTLVSAIERDWRRTQEDVRTMDAGAFCPDWWRGLDGLTKVSAFEKQWARPEILCRLVGDRPQQLGAADGRTLQLLLGSAFPVPVPAAFGAAAMVAAVPADADGVG